MDLKITGLEEIDAAFRALGDPRELDRNVSRSGKKAMRPVLDMARALAPQRTGALKRSLTITSRKLKNGNRSIRVGPDTRYYGRISKTGAVNLGKMARPANYAHLVEFGHHSAAASGISARSARGLSRRKGSFVDRSFVMPKPFLRPAWDRHRAGLMAVFMDEMMLGLERARRKAGLAG